MYDNNALAYMAEIAYLGKLQHYVYIKMNYEYNKP